jgi:23S rRNA (cytosine1962-C5)-methyltransferase
MTPLKKLRLKKNEDRRLRAGHIWIFSNEVDIASTSLKNFSPGEEVLVETYDKTILGVAYVNPHSLITARLFTRNAKERLNCEFLTKRMHSAYDLRSCLFSKPYYRLVFGESDGLPGLIVDRFNDTLSVQMNTAGMDIKTDDIMNALHHVLPNVQSILLRNDHPIRLQEGLEKNIIAALGTPPEKIALEENNASFHAPLWKGQKTGWFYDHRLNRTRLQTYVHKKRVLDVFSYLGAWGIQAAKWGANEVVCIDSSPLSSIWIKENAELNQVSERVSIIQEEAFDALKNLAINNELFDVIILDPPAFIKKQKDKKEGLLAYQRLNEAAIKLLAANGILISCSCSMHMKYNDLLHAIRKAALRHQVNLQLIERGHQGPDHPIHLAIPETDYLKMIIVRRGY